MVSRIAWVRAGPTRAHTGPYGPCTNPQSVNLPCNSTRKELNDLVDVAADLAQSAMDLKQPVSATQLHELNMSFTPNNTSKFKKSTIFILIN